MFNNFEESFKFSILSSELADVHVRTEAKTLLLCRFAESPKLPAVSQETTRAEPQVINLDVDETSDATESPTSPDINMESKRKRPRGDRDGSAVRELLLFHVAVVFHLSVSF